MAGYLVQSECEQRNTIKVIHSEEAFRKFMVKRAKQGFHMVRVRVLTTIYGETTYDVQLSVRRCAEPMTPGGQEVKVMLRSGTCIMRYHGKYIYRH